MNFNEKCDVPIIVPTPQQNTAPTYNTLHQIPARFNGEFWHKYGQVFTVCDLHSILRDDVLPPFQVYSVAQAFCLVVRFER